MNIDNGTSVVINLAERFGAAFGISAVNKSVGMAVLSKTANIYNVEFFDDFNSDIETVRIKHHNTEMIFGDVMTSNGKSIFAPPLMMSFSREKNIIETETNGEDNVVVERWGTQPWNIEIRGILIDLENRQYPSDQIRELHHLFKINDVLEVFGVQFEEKDIDNIYLKDISINVTEGFSDTVQFSLSATSIKEISWNLLNPEQ
ncbi:DUF6046 domain-containing protein [Riemerella anatipestifer]|uniref:DUF6046 domain-containing protein n=1 Tax=Riemerella anatipestifer TaxID=34085 RepID=A0A1S7DV27_RIEAN|nr:DUF6046 domain-containing protein [Riemerella anatipestifer]AQY22975.1 hypothetical protein AB406_2035 [Riemerella anatipestifer]MBT0556847.1 hypothetical protein [Riemerella anatipestifer]MCO7355770.1 DUF6046 domain-containing protein [Riemerella anatipestifer]MDY3351864.1 DUF6046 domain-containing protein [Riemerella anatipestifer]MDY3525047.1 DUF6046 domain-containing protein [Riemerella anatipestifer]